MGASEYDKKMAKLNGLLDISGYETPGSGQAPQEVAKQDFSQPSAPSITPDQQAQADAVRAAYQQKYNALLTPEQLQEQQADQDSRAAAIAALKKMRGGY